MLKLRLQDHEHTVRNQQEQEGSFIRLEDKYLLNEKQAARLLLLVQTKMQNAAPHPNTDYTLIKSLYFDDKTLMCLKSYLGEDSKRFKLRTRQYAPNGNWSDEIYVEYKAKTDEICKKSRFQIGLDALKELLNSQEISNLNELTQLNPLIRERTLVKRLVRVNESIRNLHLEPQIQVQYSRKAFHDGTIRLTIDTDIQTKTVQPLSIVSKINIIRDAGWVRKLKSTQSAAARSPCIVEVKHTGEIPAWLTHFLNHEGFSTEKFSKYCYATSFGLLDCLHETKPEGAL